MSTPFLSELRTFSFNYAPKGWATCNGQLLPINQNQALFSLLGTTYGGDGRTTFGLPNLQGRRPTHTGSGLTLGQSAGEEAHTLIVSELPSHNHPMLAKAASALTNPAGREPNANKVLAEPQTSSSPPTPVNIYGTGSPSGTLVNAAVGYTGGGQPHENRQPYLTLNICIALQGIFPSQN